MDTLIITDVAPRDGLQNQPTFVPTEAKLELIRLLHAAGVPSIEACSFVSPKAVPQMADAAELMAAVGRRLPELRTSALVPNQKGLERAHAAGVREVAVVLSATETMNQKNINMDLARATAVCEDTLQAARALQLRTRAYVAVAFDCPFEGPTPLNTVLRLAIRMARAGADEIVIADTIGSASPGTVKTRFDALAGELPVATLAAHFHDTRGMAVANAWAAIQAGIRRLDASVGGIGGCPFAPGAAGNAATEDLVLMAEGSGLHTGISLSGLLKAVTFAQAQLGRELGGRSMAWLRRRYAGHDAVPASS
ncbi:hydroxymethylglutaryl-CoA lyase [Parapusillimonas granuli]|uniref:Hydroxymethylglutaryl-CoA lyase n=1 Tax=Parapusillimonas granuli TaxID=380911 RepID=A0A853G2U2_9BURK|nr:hydroxymethylglutaryl-CoA lyase [Parapusillimonas granuli]MBB5215009.1 hydroxymethylglutaryl-CoA lyase [Parapusillimonas granuli]MEB2401137.1 hydroxymethylglutaryl-CoA lyase [Alcaligenaceae bacterium]NYT49330.1 hydroxymethylglutaryl-CoA lyase [Parapusillimonas granuli]